MRTGRRPARGHLPVLWLLAWTATCLLLPFSAQGAGLPGGVAVLVLGLAAATLTTALVVRQRLAPAAVASSSARPGHAGSWPVAGRPRQQHPDSAGRVRPRAPGRD